MSAPTFANTPELLGAATGDFVPSPLEQEVRKIYARSPLYAQRFPLHSEPLQWSCYREIPALSKSEIVKRGHQAFFSDYAEIERGLQAKRFEYESTGGTTQSPMTVIMEEGWWNAQTERAYLASPVLRQFVGRPCRKCVLAPVGCSSNLCPYEDHPFPHRYFDGTVYLNLSSDPFAFPETEWDRIVLELQATQPEVLEGEPVYLALLARAAKKRGARVPSLRAVIVTAGVATTARAATRLLNAAAECCANLLIVNPEDFSAGGLERLCGEFAACDLGAVPAALTAASAATSACGCKGPGH